MNFVNVSESPVTFLAEEVGEFGIHAPGLERTLMCVQSQDAVVIAKRWPHVPYERPQQSGWWGTLSDEGIDMEFRLTYEGPLPSNARPREKHVIRQAFHKQLATLWEIHGILRPLRNNATHFEILKDAKYGFTFVPLVRDKFSLGCGLDILFLRREAPGALHHGGDLDNRLKTLLDALKVPENSQELNGITSEADEEPFFCLMEKDSLLCDFRVNTDRLLWPPVIGESENDVRLIILVKVSVIDPSKTWVGWGL